MVVWMTRNCTHFITSLWKHTRMHTRTHTHTHKRINSHFPDKKTWISRLPLDFSFLGLGELTLVHIPALSLYQTKGNLNYNLS